MLIYSVRFGHAALGGGPVALGQHARLSAAIPWARTRVSQRWCDANDGPHRQRGNRDGLCVVFEVALIGFSLRRVRSEAAERSSSGRSWGEVGENGVDQ